MDLNTNITFVGLVQEADRQYEREYTLDQTPKGLLIGYDETVLRISTEIDISECGDAGSLHRIKRAVWDTGATTSGISNRVAERLGLKPIDTGISVTSIGQAEVPIYLLDIHLTRELTIRNIRVFGNPMQNRSEEFLIGMDIISKGKLIVDSTSGKTIVNFTV